MRRLGVGQGLILRAGLPEILDSRIVHERSFNRWDHGFINTEAGSF
jgi:hypothetical protein